MSEPGFLKPTPYLKYPGSKYALAPTIAPLLPADLPRRLYREPFVGAGGMYFWLAVEGFVRPETSSLSDGWEPLVACHRAIASSAEEVMAQLDELVDGGITKRYASAVAMFNQRIRAQRLSAVDGEILRARRLFSRV